MQDPSQVWQSKLLLHLSLLLAEKRVKKMKKTLMTHGISAKLRIENPLLGQEQENRLTQMS
ncbi:hypothetical protein Golob_021368 [Gossypium lobatum]|uniref:Uncharacterized protein n=1 Tax=Gossypium lobatum TaxID=34289 RepID=A0A7J8LDH6_9ROSI|nr:hypothetical protein [Gossypium lobatum]